ncbi:hypothetical protein N7509_002133 [Penicillium cosmopolitanum]|uniref:Uncharacterized protein n=1 Tax=Penicillium cosmopolitanum TaxID=1131564 RepID=A0A9W9W8V0_9EURO|nr:uncharacterized protein N7509_002133 [Penicillium cosmopolitanum]KAJ5408250.1 hypothetical protein N7509_002133 [Penicillium cosmopolitanum]
MSNDLLAEAAGHKLPRSPLHHQTTMRQVPPLANPSMDIPPGAHPGAGYPHPNGAMQSDSLIRHANPGAQPYGYPYGHQYPPGRPPWGPSRDASILRARPSASTTPLPPASPGAQP